MRDSKNDRAQTSRRKKNTIFTTREKSSNNNSKYKQSPHEYSEPGICYALQQSSQWRVHVFNLFIFIHSLSPFVVCLSLSWYCFYICCCSLAVVDLFHSILPHSKFMSAFLSRQFYSLAIGLKLVFSLYCVYFCDCKMW